MYRITITKDDVCTSYTIPREGLRLLAYAKMHDVYGDILMDIDTEQDAIEFLNKLGVNVKEL